MTRKELLEEFLHQSPMAVDLLKKHMKKEISDEEDIVCDFTYNSFDNLTQEGFLQDFCNFTDLYQAIRDGEYNIDDFYFGFKDRQVFSAKNLNEIATKVIGKGWIDKLLEMENGKETDERSDGYER